MKIDDYNIFLIRHGQSIANVHQNYSNLPDNLVSLTDLGNEQAKQVGIELKTFCDANNIDLAKARIWRSPYLRTRQTADRANEALNIASIREDITLIEHQYGLFDCMDNELCAVKYPNEWAEYMKWKTNSGKFYARFPLGESPFDVAIRIHQFFGTIARDDIKNLFIFTHGTTIRCFLLRMFHYTPEWYNDEKTAKNCSVRFISEGQDLGYIIGGPQEKSIYFK